MWPREDDGLACVDRRHLGSQGVDRVVADDLALGVAARTVQRTESLRQLVTRPALGVLAHGLDVDLVHAQGRVAHQLTAGKRAHRRLDAGRGVLEREQHVVGDGVVESFVQREDPRGVLGRQRLLDQQHDVVGRGGSRVCCGIGRFGR